MREQILLVIAILSAIVSTSAVVGMASVNAQNMTGNATGGNMTNATAGVGNMTNATAGVGNMTSPSPSPTPTQ
jgi:hypothetical protein